MHPGQTHSGEPAVVEASAADRDFLGLMLFEAAHWRPSTLRPELSQALARPELSKWLEDWGRRKGDAGVLAVGAGDAPIGAAWYRFWTDENHSYGYVSPEVPELAIAVAAEHRGRGVGTMLMSGLFLAAFRHGVAQLSLSVERDNPAVGLYRAFGFREVGTVGNAWTMLADVPAFGDAHF